MDFHALPRRDLQALCKRNGVRANMTNAAMADALRALPAVDGIEDYVKQPVALPTAAAKEAVMAVAEDNPREKQGSPLPRGRRIAVKSPEFIRRKDGEKEEEENLKRDADEEKAPALGMGRRGPSRRARAAPVVAPTTTRRAAATSKSESGDVAVEAVPAPTTRRRIQTTEAVVAEEKVPRARPTTRRAAARKTGMQQEEEEEKPQGVVSDVETVTALPVSDEAGDDSEEVEDETNPRNEEESRQEDEAVVSDAVLATVSDEVCDDAEDVKEATKPQNEDEGVVMDTPAPVEEPPVVEECKDKSAVQEPQIDAQLCAAPLPNMEDSPILGLVGQEGGAAFSDGTGSVEGPLDEEMSDGIHHGSKDMEIVPVSELPQATLTAGETTEEVGFTGDSGDANDEEKEVAAFSELLQHGTAEANEARMEDSFLFEEKEDVTVDEVLNCRADETVLLDFSGKISPAVEEEGVVSADEMPQSSVAMDEDADEDDFESEICRADEQKEVVTVENVLQASVMDNEVVGNEVMSDGIHHGSKGREIVLVSELPQATLTAGETTEEVGFTGDSGHANDEEKEVAAFSELLQHGTAVEDSFLFEEKEDVTVDEVLNCRADETVLLHFSGKISPAVEEEGVVSADEMPQSSVAMDDGADEDDFESEICRADEQKEVVTVENVLQVSVMDNEVVGNENVFSSDTPLEFNSAGDLGDRISSPLFADMLDNVIAGEPTVPEAEGVSQCMHSSSNEKRSTKLIAVEENEVKDENQNKETLVLTKLSLRKLRAKLKETLVAHKRKEAKRVALARLDENVC